MANKNPNETVTEESRYNIFQDAIQQSCHKIVHNILSYKALADSIPKMKKKFPDTLQQLHTILSSTVERKLKVELDEFITEFDIKDKLDTLDRLDAEQAELSHGETVWRPTGQPSKDLLAFDMPALQQHKEELQKYLKERQAENALEKTNILKKVERIQETEKFIEDMLVKNKKTRSVLGST